MVHAQPCLLRYDEMNSQGTDGMVDCVCSQMPGRCGMKVSNGLSMLELQIEGGRAFCPVLLHEGGQAVLFDAGLPGQLPLLRREVEAVGASLEQIKTVMITHHDMDHIGCLNRLKTVLGKDVKIMSLKEEAPYLRLDLAPAKLTPDRLSERVRQYETETGKKIIRPESLEGLRTLYASFRIEVDEELEDGQEIALMGGIIPLHTPGHVPGHTCYYLKKHSALVAGDALIAEEGKLMGPNPVHTKDLPSARKSLAKLLEYDIDSVLCYHGGLVKGDIRTRLQELIEG